MELHVAWPEPERYKWLPGVKYIPTWSLRYAENDNGVLALLEDVERNGVVAELIKGHSMAHQMARGMVKGVVGRLPVVWRLAGWL